MEAVPVIDADGEFVESVEPAVARRALREGAVRVSKTDPFTIQLLPGDSRCPRLFGKRKNMSALTRFDILKEEKDIWVKAAVPGQVSFEIPLGNGQTMPVKVPSSGDPVSLTDIAPFEAIKRAPDLRKLASPRPTRNGGFKPPALILMDEEQVVAHFEKKAKRLGYTKPDGSPDIERAATPVITDAAVTPQMTHIPETKREDPRDAGKTANLGQEGTMQITEVVHPRVLHFCMEASNDKIPENQRPSADMLLQEFEAALPLNMESLNHILSFCPYKSVKAWANRLLQEMAQDEIDGDDE